MLCIKCGMEAESVVNGNSYCKECAIRYLENNRWNEIYHNEIAYGEYVETIRIFGEDIEIKVSKP